MILPRPPPPAKAHTQGACKRFSASPDGPIALPTLRATRPVEDVAVWQFGLQVSDLIFAPSCETATLLHQVKAAKV